MNARQNPVPEPLAPEQALVRLRQYMERPAPTWSTASYGNSAAEVTFARIARTLAAEVERLTAENDRLRTQVRFLLEQVRRKDAASGEGNRALAEFLAEHSEPEPQTPLPERHCGRPSLHLPHRIIQDRRAYHCSGAAYTEEPQPITERTPCDLPNACDPDTGEPCDRHEREDAHAEGEHELCGDECAAQTGGAR